MTGLIYEVLWTRRLGLIFGHTVLAVSTVLACFMTGLGLGSLLGGRYADKIADSRAVSFLALYGRLELFIGLWAFLSIPLLSLVEKLYYSLSHAGLAGLSLYMASLAGAMVVLVPPTTAMGATLPIMSRLLVLERSTVGHLLSKLYGLNTLGALFGAGLAGFFLIPNLGSLASLTAAALLNIGIGLAAMTIGRQRESLRMEASGDATDSIQGAPAPVKRQWLVPLAFGLSGIASMSYQIAWTRGLSLSLGSSTYAFTTILTTFLAGLGFGSLLYSRFFSEKRANLESLGWLQAGIGLTGALTIPILGFMPLIFLRVVRTFELLQSGLATILVVDVILAAGLLFAPTFLMGLTFPLANQIYARGVSNLGRSVGEVYSANTLGCILGSVLAGYLAVPHLGAQWTLKLASLLCLSVALGLLHKASEKKKASARALVLLALMAGIVALPRWDQAVMSSGLFIYASHDASADTDKKLLQPPAFYRDGLSATVTVNVLGEGQVSMKVNGKIDASSTLGDRHNMYLTGYLPTLIHPNPSEVVLVGLGGGFTSESVLSVPEVKRLDVVELEPAVVEAEEYFAALNDHAAKDPRNHIHKTDGRTFILGSPQQFDVIICQPSNPWMAGIGNLFTQEYYTHCARKLKPNGVMAQWFNLYAASVKETYLVLNTFFSVFPEGSAWLSSYGDLILIGSKEKMDLDPARLKKVWRENPEVQEDFYRLSLFAPEELYGHFLFSRDSIVKKNPSQEYNTDNYPILEFSAPFNLYKSDGEFGRVLEMLHSHAEIHPALLPLTPQNELFLAQGLINVQRISSIPQNILNVDSSAKAFLHAQMAERVDPRVRVQEVRPRLQLALQLDPQNPLALAKAAELEEEQKNLEAAANLYQSALTNPPPGSTETLTLGLGHTLVGLKRFNEVEMLMTSYLKSQPDSDQALTFLGKCKLAEKNFNEAETLLKRAASLNKAGLDCRWELAQAYFNQGKLQEASATYKELLGLVPSDVTVLMNQGLLLARLGSNGQAKKHFREILEIEPNNSKAAQYLQAL